MMTSINSTEASYQVRETEKAATMKKSDNVEKEISALNNKQEDKLEISVAASKKFDTLKPAPLPGTNFEPKADPSQLGTPKGVKVDAKA